MDFEQPPTNIIISPRIKPSIIRGRYAKNFAQSFYTPKSWKPKGLRRSELTSTVRGKDATIHLDSL